MPRMAQPMISELPAEPSAFSRSTDEPIVTNSSRFELSAALARETAYSELANAPKEKAPRSSASRESASSKPKADRPLAAHKAANT